MLAGGRRPSVARGQGVDGGATFCGGRFAASLGHMARKYAELTKAPHSGSPSMPGYKLRQITDWMRTHLAEDFRLEQLALLAGLSKFHFHRLFKSAVGESPSHYHLNLRLHEAKCLLRETKKSVVDIALDIGYANPSHFA